MVAPAQQYQVVERRRPAVHPVIDVMGVAAPGRTARELAPCVTRAQCTADRGGNGAGLAPDVEDVSVRVVVHRHDAGIARQPARRFRGNVDRRVIDFERAVARHVGHVRTRRGVGARRGLHVQHYLVAVPGVPGIEVRGERHLGQPSQRVGAALTPRHFRDQARFRRLLGLAPQLVGGGLECAVQDGADLRRQSSPEHHHPVIVDPGGQVPGQMAGVGLLRSDHAIGSPPGTHDPLDVRRRARQGDIKEPLLRLGRRHTRDSSHLGVGDRPARHRGADKGQSWQRPGHPYLLARGTKVDSGAPVEPVGARQEAVVPAATFVVLAHHDQQLVSGGMDARGQLGDALAKGIDRHRVVAGGGERCEREAYSCRIVTPRIPTASAAAHSNDRAARDRRWFPVFRSRVTHPM